MIKIENTDVFGWESAIRGMRNPMNSWDKSDSKVNKLTDEFVVGGNDLKLMKSLVQAGSDHSKFMRMINVTFDITAPLYWWKEFDTYKIGTVRNSCSTMHKVTEKEFTLDNFSCEHLFDEVEFVDGDMYLLKLENIIRVLNCARASYLKAKKQKDEKLMKKYWWQIIQLLPSSYNQRATIQLNYAVLRNIYHARKNHKLDEWREFCKWIETLPYAELITASKPKAKWLKTDDEICYSEKCSACGWQGRVCTEFCDKATKKYCPNCGAEMEVSNGKTNQTNS